MRYEVGRLFILRTSYFGGLPKSYLPIFIIGMKFIHTSYFILLTSTIYLNLTFRYSL